MEKLQPLIKHKYWVIGGAALLLPFIGWWVSTVAAAKHIDERIQTLSALNVSSGSNTPNKDYIDHIEDVNKVLDGRQMKLSTRLYEEQERLHTWPGVLPKYMKDKKYREQADDQALRLYARFHLNEIDEMLKFVRQYNSSYSTDEKGRPIIQETGVLEIDKQNIPHVERARWERTRPTSDEMWDTQEDVWLTWEVLKAVNDVNADATKISDAPIRQLLTLQLRGGSRAEESAAPAQGSPMGDGDENSAPSSAPAGFTGGDSTVDGMGGGSGLPSLQVNPDSVLGSDALQTASTGGDSDSAPPPVVPGGGPIGGGMGGMGGNSQPKRRYVDDSPDLPYKTRGFYLEVTMVHDKLPELQAALVSMDWPTELLLVQQVSLHEDEIAPVVDSDSSSTMRRGMPSRIGGGGGRNGGVFPQRTQMPGFPRTNSRFGAPGGLGGGGRNGGFTTPRMPMPQFNQGASSRSGGTSFNRGGFNNRFPMADPMGGGRGFSPMGDMGGDDQRAPATSYDMAMSDPYLAHVGIVGLMTIYRSPEEMADKGENAGATADAAPSAQTEPQPVQTPGGNATPESAEPGTQTPPAATPDGNATPENPANPATPPAAPMNQTPPANPMNQTPPANPMNQTPPNAGSAPNTPEPPMKNDNPAPAPKSNPQPAKPADE